MEPRARRERERPCAAGAAGRRGGQTPLPTPPSGAHRALQGRGANARPVLRAPGRTRAHQGRAYRDSCARSSTPTSPVADWTGASSGRSARGVSTRTCWRSVASSEGCALRARCVGWWRPRPICSTTCCPVLRSGSGCCPFPGRCACLDNSVVSSFSTPRASRRVERGRRYTVSICACLRRPSAGRPCLHVVTPELTPGCCLRCCSHHAPLRFQRALR